MLNDVARDAAHGARILRRNPVFAAVVLGTLSLAMGATIAIFSLIDAWLLKPLPFPNPDRLVIGLAARRERPTEPALFLMFRNYLGWKERSESLESVSAAFPRSYLITGKDDAVKASGMAVTEEFFRTMGVSAEMGRTFSDANVPGPDAVVVSHGFWQRQLSASPDVLGTFVTLNGKPHQIIGVMPPHFDVRMLEQPSGYELWTLLDAGEDAYAPPEGRGPVAVFGRLREGVDVQAARIELDTIQRDIESRFTENLGELVVLLTPLQADNTRTVKASLFTVASAVVCLLSIACLNVGSLLVGRGLARSREAAVRAAIGCSRTRLLRQCLTESLLISLIGGAGGVLLAELATRAFASWNPLGMLPVAAIRIDGRALAFSAAVMSLVTVACGLVPALRMGAMDPALALRSGGERGTAGPPARRAQSIFIAGQIAMSVVLLAAAALLVRTLGRLSSEPLGFEPLGLTVASVALPTDEFDSSGKRNAFVARLQERLAAMPGVRRVAAGTSPLLSSGPPTSLWTGAEDSKLAHRLSAQEVTPDFFGTLGILILSGRSFDAGDSSDSRPVAVVNERAAQALFGSSAGAVGRRIRLDSQSWREVIGVVGNTRSAFFNTLEWLTNPIVYIPSSQAFSAIRDPTVRSFDFHLYVRSDQPLSLPELKKSLEPLGGNAALTRVSTASVIVTEATRQPAFRVMLLSSFASASLLLSAMGVYGVVSQSVSQRTREVGIRIALGAGRKDIVRTVTRHAVTAAIAGTIAGGGAAFGLANTLRGVLYGVRPTDARSWFWAASLLVIVTGIAAFVPAIRATRIHPTEALRAD